jgi:endogenous inhibitor of DNA gyrase (YacG/DUF329 family)
MMKLTCPTCSKSLQIEKMEDLPSFPFCSDRCKLVDLGRWIDGAYVIPGSEAGGSAPKAAKATNGVAVTEGEEDDSDL